MKRSKAKTKTTAPTVGEERLMTVLLAPVVSEKATQIADRYNQVVFRVRPDATKKDVKAAVELMWKEKKLEVASVPEPIGATGTRLESTSASSVVT